MDGILEVFLGLVLGAIAMYWLFSLFRRKKSKELTTHQSTVLLEKIKSVCKLISVEGDFAEIYKYENTKEHFMSLVSSKKKGILKEDWYPFNSPGAKEKMRNDLKKILMHSDESKKKIVLTSFPQPEILSIEPELDFYDIKNGLFNSFTPEDLTSLNKEAKKHKAD